MEAVGERKDVSKIWELLKVWGPAWLVMIADVDAASVITAAESGAVYGTRLEDWSMDLLKVYPTRNSSGPFWWRRLTSSAL